MKEADGTVVTAIAAVTEAAVLVNYRLSVCWSILQPYCAR